MKKSASISMISMLPLIFGVFAIWWYLSTANPPKINLPQQASEMTTSTEMDTEMAGVFGGHFNSTDHRTSPACIAGAWGYSLSGYLSQQGNGSSGSVQIWAGINGDYASVAILMIVGKQVNFTVIRGPVIDLGFGTAPEKFLSLGGGKFLDSSNATWVAAWVMSSTIGKDDDPSKFLTVGQGLTEWGYYQTKYNLFIPVAAVYLPPSPFQ